MTPLRATITALVGAGALAIAGGCTPSIPTDPVPALMQFDPQSAPPLVPQPTSLIINPQTGHIDFSIAGTPVPADCTIPTGWSAECEFNQYLQSLDGFPTVTPATTPASAALDPATLSVGTNVVVVAAKGGAVDVQVGFDTARKLLTVRPQPSWSVGDLYWVAVRGYANGVKTVGGGDVVGSPTQFLLKQETSLTCDAPDPAHLDPACPAFALLGQAQPDTAAMSVFQLEAIRRGIVATGGWELMAAAGLPKAEVAVLWSFPTHKASVAEVDPTVGLVPKRTAPDVIRVGVRGTVDPATVTPFVVRTQLGSIVLMDLTAAQAGDLAAGFPTVTTTFRAGGIDIQGSAPFVTGHQYGIFMNRKLHDATGASLVPSPISVLLRLRGELVGSDGKSKISTIADSDAAMLEAGRLQLAMLFDTPSFASLTGVSREDLVYCYAFALEASP